MKIRYGKERGQSRKSWLDSKHSFSFDQYQDSQWDSFGHLRVFNEDWIAPGSGFGMHPHRDMEIVTVMLSGEMRHRDSMGHEQSLHADEVQAMTAGTGLFHSEWNPTEQQTHLLQLWFYPEKKGLAPTYDQFKVAEGKTQILASGFGSGLKINTKTELLRHRLAAGETWTATPDAKTYLHIIEGCIKIDEQTLSTGDAIAFDRESADISGLADSQLIIINMY